MSLIATIKGGVDKAWIAFGDIIQPVTYQRVVRGAYNPATSGQPQTVTQVTVRAALLDYDTKLINNTDIRVGDLNCIVRARDLAFEPREGDTVMHGATRWTVTMVRGEPRIFWDLTLRR